MNSLTQRSLALVQRRSEDKELCHRQGAGGCNCEDDGRSRPDEQDDDDESDSKETRLTLMEEVLLLGLKDQEVWAQRTGRAWRREAWTSDGLQVGAGLGLRMGLGRAPALLAPVPRSPEDPAYPEEC
ncbi:Golgi phosphoprotein 3 [Sciurus carolinensis]|uniref:Golgi phosphoprotein 3 n=1 Tax=Sciurus carolinensis TaxID=30640 RepID=A0AA41NH04_SCICA|nr:Golgi phosphoprotein 3 [Sciurus carolinensis]